MSKDSIGEGQYSRENYHIGIANEGDTITLICPTLCPRLDRKGRVTETYLRNHWRFNPKGTGLIRQIDFSDGRYHIDNHLNFIILEGSVNDTGTYYCFRPKKSESELIAAFAITIVKNQQRQISIAKMGFENEESFSIWWRKTDWSLCDRCGSVGLSKQIGFCHIKPVDIPDLIKNPILQFLFYQNGSIPCRSFLVPTFISDVVKKFGDKIIYRLCSTNCSQGIELIKDHSSGKVIDFIDKSIDIYSVNQPLPSFSETLPHKAINRNAGSSILMVCPGRRGNQPIQWFNNSRFLSPIRVNERTLGRVKVDFHYRLHIRRLETYDSQVYSCRSHGKKIGTVFLNVVLVELNVISPKIYKYIQFYVLAIGIFLIASSIYKNRFRKF
ncbi:Ig-like V-type domain-containing protein FAM187A [Panonychus citri]|uniref:Ig-like V-type domain-containing protein FAM187A n=1 Tax=Panonychus citri TaxID=50023 RepID=UPI002307649D|nr:Ig-like V-type domain-containing protein FAM187A [Panonychus citri]